MDTEVALGFDNPGTYEYDVDLPITRISGRVVDNKRVPVEGVDLSILLEEDGRRLRDSLLGSGEKAQSSTELERRATTDVDGRFEARGVLADRPLVLVARGKQIRTTRSEPFTVEVDGVRDGIELVVRPAGTLRVTVTRPDGSRAPNVAVHASFRGKKRGDAEVVHQRTNGQGRVVLDGLVPGKWRVRVDPPERGMEEDPLPHQDVEVEARRRTDVSFQLP